MSSSEYVILRSWRTYSCSFPGIGSGVQYLNPDLDCRHALEPMNRPDGKTLNSKGERHGSATREKCATHVSGALGVEDVVRDADSIQVDRNTTT